MPTVSKCKVCEVACDWLSSDLVHWTAICPCCREYMGWLYEDRIQTTLTDRTAGEPYWTFTFMERVA